MRPPTPIEFLVFEELARDQEETPGICCYEQERELLTHQQASTAQESSQTTVVAGS